MRLILCENDREVTLTAAKLVQSQILLKPASVLGLATGSTPVGMYAELVRMYEAKELDFSSVKTFNLDEYYPIEPTNENSYHFFMHRHLFDHVNLRPENTHLPCGNGSEPEKDAVAYDKMLQEHNIDLQILGIGENGHIAFNEPDECLQAGTHLTALTDSTVAANARFFESEKEVPRHAVTMGMASILHARKILLLISGKKKHCVTEQLFNDLISTTIPATLLKLHRDVVVICDKAAYFG